MIDEKLRKILDEEVIQPIIYGEGVNPKDYFGIDVEDIVAQIKSAFADDTEHYCPRFGMGYNNACETRTTGQEWLSRFEKNINGEDWPKLPLSRKRVLTYVDVMEAARKASERENQA